MKQTDSANVGSCASSVRSSFVCVLYSTHHFTPQWMFTGGVRKVISHGHEHIPTESQQYTVRHDSHLGQPMLLHRSFHTSKRLQPASDRFCLNANLLTVKAQRQWAGMALFGIATRYGMDGPVIESRPDRPWGPPSIQYYGYREFSVGKTGGACVNQPPSSSEVKESAEL